MFTHYFCQNGQMLKKKKKSKGIFYPTEDAHWLSVFPCEVFWGQLLATYASIVVFKWVIIIFFSRLPNCSITSRPTKKPRPVSFSGPDPSAVPNPLSLTLTTLFTWTLFFLRLTSAPKFTGLLLESPEKQMISYLLLNACLLYTSPSPRDRG